MSQFKSPHFIQHLYLNIFYLHISYTGAIVMYKHIISPPLVNNFNFIEANIEHQQELE